MKEALLSVVALMSLIGQSLIAVAAQPSERASERTQEVREKLESLFHKDPAARAPVAELGLPEAMRDRLDSNGDGFVTRAEAQPFLAQSAAMPAQEPRDRSDFTLLRDEGFPPERQSRGRPFLPGQLSDADIVMGVVIGGEPRAYPVNYMNGPTNEVVNDSLGGESIAPSW